MKKWTSFHKDHQVPLVAIIRGVEPSDVLDVAEALLEQGFTIIEVPLNSPNALESIQILVDNMADRALVGAGTVTNVKDAQAVLETGAKLIVTPNVNPEIIDLARIHDCCVFPGVITPSEAFSALNHGATGIKLFPADVIGLDGYKALKSVLPEETICLPVGGISPTAESMQPWIEAGVSGFGLGSALYKPQMTLEQIKSNAKQFVETYTSLA
ncbi:2-dehydro-3-deoxy-6-phosphogalactonate aldolase [Vibrio agarivorans]|uniref:2-dehydro-3-deoxy-6-phosphogalactonate aldolase n=1 Tax=Vibrio agarivorans TaxID=153622 RepID=UPI00222FF2B1|nr:2-dehydro-3-deoxy-6-phosphogalactonate aldolase [Vibrio agarivorans]